MEEKLNSKDRGRTNYKRRSKSTQRSGNKSRQYRVDSSDREDSKNYSPNTKMNDASWYTKNAQLALDAGRLSFNVPTGSKILWDTSSKVTSINNVSPTDYNLPGVMALSFAPTYGLESKESDPLNVAARNIYSYVRYANSGAKNYDPVDLMLYLLAMDNIYMYYQKMCRIYGTVMIFNQLNRHLPSTLAEALGFDYNDIVTNLANFRTYINTIGAKIGSLCVPASFPLFMRHMWMCSGVYADSPTPKAQFYVFNPIAVGVYNERSSNTGGFLASRLINNDDTMAKMMTTMDTLINAVVASEDCGIISGDIRKAYGEGGLFAVSQISDDYRTLPVYSEEVLRQIQNATVLEGISYAGLKMVEQDVNSNILLSSAKFYASSEFVAGSRILTGSDAQPSPEEVLVNSRLMIMGTVAEGTPSGTPSPSNPIPYVFTPTAIGTEAIVGARVYGVKQITNADESYDLYYCKGSPNNSFGNRVTAYVKFFNAYALSETFNYHPRFGIAEVTAEGDGHITGEYVRTFQDVDNYCVVDDSVLYNLHQTALLSLFNISA